MPKSKSPQRDIKIVNEDDELNKWKNVDRLPPPINMVSNITDKARYGSTLRGVFQK